ncbi:MAG: N-acetylmuramoyl-L-alanine amidase [Rhodanobacteraceae bacterium]
MNDTLRIRDEPLPYVERLQQRPVEAIDLVVIHCTELPDLATARAYGESVLHADETGNSGHYYVDRDGSVLRYVPDDRIAHHVRGHNEHSIGVELVNAGRYPDWFDSRGQTMKEPYLPEQVAALLRLLAHLQVGLPHLHNIAGHADLDTGVVAASDDATRQVRRKLDPGPLFPWTQVLAHCALERLGFGAPSTKG